MGGLVGDNDGTNEGQILGAADGLLLGSIDTLGAEDGQYLCVGMNDIDGFELGVTDGLSDGAWLTDGLSDGGKDGLDDGSTLGDVDGFTDGIDVGSKEGSVVGDTEGASLGISIIRPRPVIGTF